MELIKKIKEAAITLVNNKEYRKNFIRYFIVGISAVALDYLLFLLISNVILPDEFAINVIGFEIINPNISHTVSMVCGTVFSYTMNRIWSFQSTGKVLPQLVKFALLFLFNLAVTNIAIYFLYSLGIPKELAKLFMQGLMTCWNFVLYKKVVYKN